MVTCPFCGSEAVVRPAMRHRTKKYETKRGKPAVERWCEPRKGWFCPNCKQVFSGNEGL